MHEAIKQEITLAKPRRALGWAPMPEYGVPIGHLDHVSRWGSRDSVKWKVSSENG